MKVKIGEKYIIGLTYISSVDETVEYGTIVSSTDDM